MLEDQPWRDRFGPSCFADLGPDLPCICRTLLVQANPGLNLSKGATHNDEQHRTSSTTNAQPNIHTQNTHTPTNPTKPIKTRLCILVRRDFCFELSIVIFLDVLSRSMILYFSIVLNLHMHTMFFNCDGKSFLKSFSHSYVRSICFRFCSLSSAFLLRHGYLFCQT